MISNFLFYEDDVSLQEKYNYVQLKLEIRELLKSDFNRKVLVEILLDLQKDIAGDARNRLFDLYKDLGLHQDAFEKLKSRRWEVISKGILELTQLQVEESYGFIKKFINHRRGVIRKQAQLATVSLKHEGIVYFLDTCKHRISEWQQLKLLDILRNFEDFQPPRFKAWLTAKNKDVVLFSLRLIKYYKQNDANSSLIELVKHKNDQVKIEAISCIKDFVVFEALETLKAVFWKCSVSVKLALLDAVASLGKQEEISFLKEVEKRENNFIVKSKAVSAINTISPGMVMPTHGIEPIPAYEEDQEELMIEEMAASEELEPSIESSEARSEIAEEEVIRKNAETQEEPESTSLSEEETPEEIEMQEETKPVHFDEVQLNWKLPEQEEDHTKVDTEEVAINTDSASNNEELQPIEDLNEFKINDLEEIIMRAKEEYQEELTSLSSESRINSEEAYWEAVLDPEKEDEIVFDLCLMEELEDILAQAIRPEDSYAQHEILPLDFLPIVAEEACEEQKEGQSSSDPIMHIEVEEEVVHQDAKFVEELDRILQKVRTSETEEEEITLNFIPLVVESEQDEVPQSHAEEQELPIEDLEVVYEEEKGLIESREEASITLPWERPVEEEKTEALEEISTALVEASNEEYKSEDVQHEPQFDLFDALDDRVSIFNELFRTCDAESKLILLDEILAVGDERDLRFLDTLANDEDARVRNKAKKIGEALKTYLESQLPDETVCLEMDETQDALVENPGEPESEEETSHGELLPLEDCFLQNESFETQRLGLFEIDFELDEVYGATETSMLSSVGQEVLNQDPQTNLLEDILSLPTKLIQKFNG